MEQYAPFLIAEDPRIRELFDVTHEAAHQGLSLIEDPYPAFHRLRREAPVHRGSLGSLIGVHSATEGLYAAEGLTTYTTFSFEASNTALMENETYSSEVYWKLRVPQFLGDTILNKIGNDHRSYRDPLQPLFKPSMAESWWNEQFIAPAAEILVSHIERRGHSDLFLDVCARMPFYVASAAFGVPADLALDFRIAMEAASAGKDLAARLAGKTRAIEILNAVVEARRREPADDIISKFLEAERTLPDGTTRPYTTEEIVDHTRLVVFAGGGTTWRQLGILLYALLDHPDQLEEVRANPALARAAALEASRWHVTDPVFPRMTTKDVELCGTTIPAGSIVEVCIGAANRDEARWEDPDRFDLHRPIQRSLAFVSGPHSCLGQHVARQEMETALNLVLERLPNLRWDPAAEHPVITGALVARGPTALPVVWG